jgi:hypothetical protein
MEANPFYTNRNLYKGHLKQKIVAITQGTELRQKSTLGSSVITPQVKFGKTEDEILNKVITELQYSILINKIK